MTFQWLQSSRVGQLPMATLAPLSPAAATSAFAAPMPPPSRLPTPPRPQVTFATLQPVTPAPRFVPVEECVTAVWPDGSTRTIRPGGCPPGAAFRVVNAGMPQQQCFCDCPAGTSWNADPPACAPTPVPPGPPVIRAIDTPGRRLRGAPVRVRAQTQTQILFEGYVQNDRLQICIEQARIFASGGRPAGLPSGPHLRGPSQYFVITGPGGRSLWGGYLSQDAINAVVQCLRGGPIVGVELWPMGETTVPGYGMV